MNRFFPLLLSPAFPEGVFATGASATVEFHTAPGCRVVTPAPELAVREIGFGSTPFLLCHAAFTEASMFAPLVNQLATD